LHHTIYLTVREFRAPHRTVDGENHAQRSLRRSLTSLLFNAVYGSHPLL
jgi:hypothetical protein